MEARGELDVVGVAKATGLKPSGSALIVIALFLIAAVPVLGSDEAQRLQTVKSLYEQKRWDEAAREARGPESQSPDFDYYAGMALSHLQKWNEALAAFSAGARKAPNDARILTERAGPEYKLNQFARAKQDLLRSLRLGSADPYVPEFLGTIYLLEGNTEAALKYWNRLDRPRLAGAIVVPSPVTNKQLLERAFAFAPPATLERTALLETEALMGNLQVFPQVRVELAPGPAQPDNGQFLARTHVSERSGWGSSVVEGLLSLLRGVPYQTAYPSYYNFRGQAVNFDSLVRWDPEKRRAAANLTLPWFQQPSKRLGIAFDQRDENWNLSQSFHATNIAISDLNLRSFAGRANLHVIEGGRWGLEVGGEVSARDFRNVPRGLPRGAAAFFTSAKTTEAWLGAYRSLIRVPERRLTVDISGEARAGRNYGTGLGAFGGMRGEVKTQWFPKARGDDYEFVTKMRAGGIFGEVTLDQLYQLGAERDNELWIRGHGGTLGGRKGRAPLGRRFALINSDFLKTVYGGALFRVQLGPFLDTGSIADASGLFGSQKWLVDSGIQTRIRVLSSVSVTLSYGRDLRNGRGLFYGNAAR